MWRHAGIGSACRLNSSRAASALARVSGTYGTRKRLLLTAVVFPFLCASCVLDGRFVLDMFDITYQKMFANTCHGLFVCCQSQATGSFQLVGGERRLVAHLELDTCLLKSAQRVRLLTTVHAPFVKGRAL